MAGLSLEIKSDLVFKVNATYINSNTLMLRLHCLTKEYMEELIKYLKTNQYKKINIFFDNESIHPFNLNLFIYQFEVMSIDEPNYVFSDNLYTLSILGSEIKQDDLKGSFYQTIAGLFQKNLNMVILQLQKEVGGSAAGKFELTKGTLSEFDPALMFYVEKVKTVNGEEILVDSFLDSLTFNLSKEK